MPDEVREKVTRILEDNNYKKNMLKLMSHQSKVDGVKRAADWIEN